MTMDELKANKNRVCLPQYVRDLLNNIALDAGFFDSCVNLSAGSNQDDGFFGSLVAVSITSKRNTDCNGNDSTEKETLHLLCKLMPGTMETRSEMNMIELFKREAFFYQKVFPEFEKFQSRKGVNKSNGFFGYPKCYACICDEQLDQFVIIMEDLRFRNYEMWPKKRPVNLHHVQMVLKEMAKFHAVSLAMKAQQPDIFKELAVVYDLFRGLMKRQTFIHYFDGSHGRAFGILDQHLPQHASKFRAIWKNSLKHLNEVLNGKDFEPYAVLVHADCWNNNTLFQYNSVSNATEYSAFN